jgi:hypothetical protein
VEIMTSIDRKFSRRISDKFWLAILSLLILAVFPAARAKAQSGLKTINPPQGGMIVYGQVDGQSTEAGAMGAILKHIHESMGDKPQVGKLFDVKGSESVAVFFTVKRHDGGTSAGMIIAAKPSTDHVEAALLSDDAPRFGKSMGPMMKLLFAQWHPLQAPGGGAGAGSGPGTGQSASAAQLHQLVTQDRSAAISVPDGWQLVPNMSSGGTLVATGPNGEAAEMGITFLAQDTNNPAVQRTMQTLRQGGLRNSAYAQANYIPYGADMQKTFVYFMGKLRQKAGLPAASFNFSSVTPARGSSTEHCVRMDGTTDFSDQKGPRGIDVLFCELPPGRFGGWSSVANMTTAPTAVYAREQATLSAVMESYQFDQRVVQNEGAQLAAPAIAQIHAIGRAAAQQAADAHRMEDIHNSSVYERWDSNDKRNQAFSNYLLDQTVVLDNQNNAHGTLWNQDADLLVKTDPNRFEYVNAPNYWKGIDY